MDPITILAGIKSGLAAGKTVAGLSESDKATIKDLLRKSGILVGD